MSKIKVAEFKGAYKAFNGGPSKECEEYIHKHRIKKEDIIKICYSSENNYSSILLVYEVPDSFDVEVKNFRDAFEKN